MKAPRASYVAHKVQQGALELPLAQLELVWGQAGKVWGQGGQLEGHGTPPDRRREA